LTSIERYTNLLKFKMYNGNIGAEPFDSCSTMLIPQTPLALWVNSNAHVK